MKLSERYEILLKAIHANKDVPQQFSARHLVTRCKGLALKDPANMELKIAIVALVGTSLSIKALGKLLSEVIHGRRFGDYQIEGHRTKDGTNYSCWQFTLLYFGAPVPEPVKPEVKLSREDKKLFAKEDHATVLGVQQLIADQEAADKLAADQQRRLEHAENREVLEELAKKNAEQKRALRQPSDPFERLREENARAYRDMEARKPAYFKWKLGERAFMRGQWGRYTGTPDNKSWESDDYSASDRTGLILSIVETAPPDTRPGGDMLRWYEEQSFLAMQRGDTRSIEEIAASSRVWDSTMGISKVGGAIPLGRHIGNFCQGNESESDLMDLKFRGYK